MAKHKEPQVPSTPGKMLVMMIQLEGDSTTIQEGIRTFKEAMSRTMPQGVPRPNLPQAALSALPAPAAEHNGEAHTNGEVLEQAGVPDSVLDAESSTPSSTSAKSNKPLPKMNLVKDLDLRPADKPHLKALLEEKKPKDQNEKIAVCVYYLAV